MSRRDTWIVSRSSGNCGSLVKHGVWSVVRNAAGWAAIPARSPTAARIARRIGSIRAGSCSQLAPTRAAPPSAICLAHSAAVCPSEHRSVVGRKLMNGDDRQAARGGALQPDPHLLQVEERLEDEEIDPGRLEQLDLLAEQVADVPGGTRALPLEELRPGHAAGDERRVPGDLLRQPDGGRVDRLGLLADTRPGRASRGCRRTSGPGAPAPRR